MNRHASHLPTPFYGIEISGKRLEGGLGFGPDGRPAVLAHSVAYPGMGQGIVNGMAWSKIASEYPVLQPELAGSRERAVIPTMMRESCNSWLQNWTTFGAHGYLDGLHAIYDRGHHIYDYRWRHLDARAIQDELGLKVSPILIETRGY